MKKQRIWTVGLLAAWMACPAARAESLRAVGDRVNLRARPSLDAEVLGQVNDGDILTVRSIQGDWVEVDVPPHVDLYVHRDFVRDGVIQAAKLNVRGGPGINYQVAGSVERGTPVESRGAVGEWIKIAPPAGCSVWVSRNFVERMAPAPGTPPPETAVVPPAPPSAGEPPPLAPRVGTPPAAGAAAQEPPPGYRLAPVEGQGRLVQREGRVKPVGFMFSRPTRYQLVQEQGGHADTVCFLYGNEQQLRSMENKVIQIRGREYWVQGVRHALVAIDQIRLAP